MITAGCMVHFGVDPLGIAGNGVIEVQSWSALERRFGLDQGPIHTFTDREILVSCP